MSFTGPGACGKTSADKRIGLAIQGWFSWMLPAQGGEVGRRAEGCGYPISVLIHAIGHGSVQTSCLLAI